MILCRASRFNPALRGATDRVQRAAGLDGISRTQVAAARARGIVFTLMNTRKDTLPRIVVATAMACTLFAAGCSKQEPAPSASAGPKPASTAATAPAQTAPQPAQPAPTPPPAPTPQVATPPATPATPAPLATPAMPAPPAVASAPASPASPLTALQGGAATTGDSTSANLANTAAALQTQAADLLTKYSGELDTLKSGALAVKSYVDQHPDVLPEAAKAKYQQLNAMVPQLESLVGTLKDYKNADLTTLVPKLQNDFAKAKSLYTEVRSLLPAQL